MTEVQRGRGKENIIVAVNKGEYSQVPAMPMMPTKSRIFAISLAVRTPLLAAR
jgi:hypothetical protein